MVPSPDHTAILLPLGVAAVLTFCTVGIHALAHLAGDPVRSLRVEAWPRRRLVLERRSDSSWSHTDLTRCTFGRYSYVGFGV